MASSPPACITLPSSQLLWPTPDPSNIHSGTSPSQFFYTPPTTPTTDNDLYFTPPTSPPHNPPPSIRNSADSAIPDPDSEDIFTVPSDIAIDFALDEEGLSVLEKIYLYSRSKAYHHRIFIIHQLRDYLDHVTPQEAVEYVLPLLSGLAMDDEDTVREALAAELVPVIWWFFSHCQVIPDDLTHEEMYASSSTTVTISVQSFTPILGTLLLNENKRVAVLARDALVAFLARINKLDEKLHGVKKPRRRPISHQPWEPQEELDDDPLPYVGLFGSRERTLFRHEILQQIVVGLGQLDDEEDVHHHHPHQQSQHEPHLSQASDWSNPYFPPVSYDPTTRSSTSSPVSDSHSTRSSSNQCSNASIRNSPIHDYSPGVDLPPGVTTSTPSHSPVRGESIPKPSLPGSPMNVDNDVVGCYEDQATLGRIACMALVAAVTAGGPLDDGTLKSFLDEVERVVHDPHFKVRQAASFALGALAKEIPDNLVPRLMPLFDFLRWDTFWVVRHSALFALPAILERLSPAQRRTVALETIVALSADKDATVRCGVLECLGEVLYTFAGDDGGPPEQLVQLFLGRRDDKNIRVGQKQTFTSLYSALKAQNVTPLESFYKQEKRPLICAFNFPAIVLTLGAERWGEVRENYLDLVQNPNVNVSRTLAASVGEIAKVIGAEKAKQDLVGVWRGFLRSYESDVRMKTLESVADLMKVVVTVGGVKVGRDIVDEVGKNWKEDMFRGWRERECVQQRLVAWFRIVCDKGWVDRETVEIFRDLLLKGLEDSAANVREAAIASIPELWALCSSRPEAIDIFRAAVKQLATSPMSRRRMTYVASQQTLALTFDKEGHTLLPLDGPSLKMVAKLADDNIEGVRIGVARFAALIYRNMLRHANPIPGDLLELLRRLSLDPSQEVRTYVAQAVLEESAQRADTPPLEGKRAKEKAGQMVLFSRPPISSSRPISNEGSLQNADMSCDGDEFLSVGSRTSMTTSMSGVESDSLSSSDGSMSIYSTAGSAGQLSINSGVVSVYRERSRSSSSSSSSSYTYDLVGCEQLQVPV